MSQNSQGLKLVGTETGFGTWSEKVVWGLAQLSLPTTCHLHEYTVPFLIFIYLSHFILLTYALENMYAC